MVRFHSVKVHGQVEGMEKKGFVGVCVLDTSNGKRITQVRREVWLGGTFVKPGARKVTRTLAKKWNHRARLGLV